MKKIYVLSWLVFLMFSCAKEKAPISSPVTTEPSKNVRAIKPSTLNPGSGATIVYDPSSGLYKANYAGAELVFSPIPLNTNYTDGDVVNTSVSCTNCTFFASAANGYFAASIPVMPASAKNGILTQLSTYNKQFSDYVNLKMDSVTLTYKQATIPNFPSVSSTYSAAVSGVVVRSHSSPTSCMVLPSTYTPNPVPRNVPPGTPISVGFLASQLHPYTVFEFQGKGSATGVISSVILHFSPDITVTWSGSYTSLTNSSGTHYYVTVDIYHDNVLYEHFEHVEASKYIL